MPCQLKNFITIRNQRDLVLKSESPLRQGGNSIFLHYCNSQEDQTTPEKNVGGFFCKIAKRCAQWQQVTILPPKFSHLRSWILEFDISMHMIFQAKNSNGPVTYGCHARLSPIRLELPVALRYKG